MNNKRQKPAATKAHGKQTAQPRATTAEIDPRVAAAIAQGEIVRRKLAAADGGAMSGREAAFLLGIPEAAVIRRWRGYRLVGWKEDNAVHFPVWQFQGGTLLPGLEKVLQIFRSHDQWRVLLYFLATHRSLSSRRPLDLLREGEAAAVIKQATAHAEECSW